MRSCTTFNILSWASRAHLQVVSPPFSENGKIRPFELQRQTGGKITTAKIPRMMRENEGTCVTGSPPEQSALRRGQRRTEGGFYRTNSHFDHLGPTPLARFVFRGFQRISCHRFKVPSPPERISTPIIILPGPNWSRGGRDGSGRRNYGPQFPMNGAKFSWPTTAPATTMTM